MLCSHLTLWQTTLLVKTFDSNSFNDFGVILSPFLREVEMVFQLSLGLFFEEDACTKRVSLIAPKHSFLS